MLGRRYAIYCADAKITDGICHKDIITGTILSGSIPQGIALGLLWVAQRTYTDSCCNKENKGSFTGLFFLIYQLAFALGPTASTFISGNFSVGTFFDVSVGVMLVVMIMFMFVKEPVPYESE